jgi:cell division protein FtsQ
LFFNRQTIQKRTKSQQKIQATTKTAGRGLILLFKIIIIAALLALLWHGRSYTKANNFPIKQVKIVSASEHVDQEFLQKTIETYTKSGFFYLNVNEMKRQLLKLPWIYEVAVQRKWPDTVIVNVIEQQAALQWGNKALINHKGEVFAPPVFTFPKELPVIFGPEERRLEIFTLYQKAQQYFEPLDLTIRKLLFNPQSYWEILLKNNTTIYLKEGDPLAQLELLVDLYQRITAGHKSQPKSIDLRYYTGGFAVKWDM